MSKKDLYEAFTERGKVRNKYYIPIKLNKVKWNYQRTLDISDIEELEDKLMQNSTFYEMKRYRKEYYSEGCNWNFSVIERLVDSYVGKHIDELQLKCMSYSKRYRHSLWKWTLCSFSEYLYIDNRGYFLDWSVINSHYLDESNTIQRCPSRQEYEDNLSSIRKEQKTKVDINSIPHRESYYYLYPKKDGYKQHYYLSGDDNKTYELHISDGGYRDGKWHWSSNYIWHYAPYEGWYELKKVVSIKESKELILNNGCPVWIKDELKEYAAFKVHTSESIQYELVYDRWMTRKVLHQ